MAEIERLGSQDRSPLIDYAKKRYWGNPSNDLQFQIRLARVSHEFGYIGNFDYMGKYYLCPDPKRFWNIFTLGFLNPGNFNLGYRMFNWVPFNRWVNAAQLMEDRGVTLDFHNGSGLFFSRRETWIMKCFNGTTLIAFAKNPIYSMPVDKSMYMHCYSPDGVMYTKEGYQDTRAAYEVEGVTYYAAPEWVALKDKWQKAVNLNLGKVNVYHNGYLVNMADIKPEVGDQIEYVYDPTIFRRLTFRYDGLKNYYSDRDQNRKLILFPWFTNTERRYYYFDDCRYYVWNRLLKRGIYFHRNNQNAVRQLTHQDYGISADYVESLIERMIAEDTTGKTKKSDFDIIVDYITTDWKTTLGPTDCRIADLYLLEDPTKILNAMTGTLSTVPFWQATALEQSGHNKLLGLEYTDITNKAVFNALGYNGVSQALSQTPAFMPGINPGTTGYKEIYPTPPFLNGRGYLIPPTYVNRSTVYEYDLNGYLLRTVPVINAERYLPSGTDVGICEFALGENTSYLDAVLTKSSINVRSDVGHRVYRAPWKIGDNSEAETKTFWSNEWSIAKDGLPFVNSETVVSINNGNAVDDPLNPKPWDGGELAGAWEDITDTELYTLDKSTGLLTWNFSTVNYLGMVVYDSKHLYLEKTISHLDNSISFTLNAMWEIGGVVLPIRPYQLDIWYGKKGKSLIENVDYVVKFPSVYIISKELLEEGNSHFFRIRAVGLGKDGPYNRSELGFVTNGVIGYNGRYNVRINRPTKTICHGHLMLTQSVDWAETKGHGNNLNGMEGMPYEVKHIACLNRYAEPYETLYGIDEDVSRDELVSAYLTKYATYKPAVPPVQPTQTDKYLLFSPFLSQFYNELRIGSISTPTGTITTQMVYDLTANIRWLLEFDPTVLNMTPSYFVIDPLSNIGMQPITTQQLTLLTMANDLFLQGKLAIRGHFEVVAK